DVRKHAVKNVGLTDDQVNKIITPLEGMYLIADHLRTLIFAIADGALPSNVGGGYNLRMMIRRIRGTVDRMNLKLDIDELVDMHIDYLKDTYPELDEKRQDVKTILKIESQRYVESKSRMKKIAKKMRQQDRAPTVDELITLYESDGVTPEYLKEINAISEIPSSFYVKLSDLHQSDRKKTVEQLSIEGLPETEMLFYKDDPMSFDAKVLRVIDQSVVLDRTSFYARGGGQEPDYGTISGSKVIDVNKHGSVILHKLDGDIPKEGDTVSCIVDETRRSNITKNHTSTHILNASSRKILGSWVWQHSAFKDDDHARLDITHHSSLTKKQKQEIEDAANDMVKQDLSVTIEYFDRGTAEQKYGFRIYQGGVVPVKSVRIVSIEDKDIEACGGTHVKKTGDIELIKITRTKRIQDGVIRIEFVSGNTAQEYVSEQESTLVEMSEMKKGKEEIKREREENKEETRRIIPLIVEDFVKKNTDTNDKKIIWKDIHLEKTDFGKLCFVSSSVYDEFFHMNLGKQLIKKDSSLVYFGIFEDNNMSRIIVYAGENVPEDKNARSLVTEISKILGGAGGGDATFAQGGGKNRDKMSEALSKAKSMVLE
ncbi:alanine--tRNA ligase, partial [Marine Group I thaumarchaeote]|nr:alanine--tRNA ligase [Marine Group I thaumarchaeote]